MAIITQIVVQERKKDRCNVFVDGEFAFAISLELVLKFRLKAGCEISEQELDNIVFEGQKAEALSKALNYVSKSLKTNKQVKTYLFGKGYNENVVFYVLDKLKEYSYINDADYARQYVENCSLTQGKRMIEAKLMAKGIRKADIDLAFDSIEIPQKENAIKLAQKYLRNKEKTRENFAKTYRYLMGRGYSYEEADFAVSSFKEE